MQFFNLPYTFILLLIFLRNFSVKPDLKEQGYCVIFVQSVQLWGLGQFKAVSKKHWFATQKLDGKVAKCQNLTIKGEDTSYMTAYYTHNYCNFYIIYELIFF